MKNLWDRIRRWLIRKLGGFDELPQPVAEQTLIEIHRKDRKIVPIRARVLIRDFEANSMSPDELEHMAKMQLADEIARELVSSDAMYVFSAPDPKMCAVKFSGCVSVVL